MVFRRRLKPQTWEEEPKTPDCTKVLLAYPRHATPSVPAGILEAAGYCVSVCESEDDERCPLVAEGYCAVVDDADLIISALGVARDRTQRILSEIDEKHPDKAVLVFANAGDHDSLHRLPERHTVVAPPHSRQELLDDVETVLASHQACA
ncbi:MAG: hypothetical protein JJLCMIEE_01053 [Acidimicrobiales bacterium]|nr:MAG: hypothetical protein EDR02_07690 [Actinomycetota bacterium]MBV6507995.1 hypothetical protein [Acidimicrobiales bacterium]RIK06964.1 MAG: hypothetical protein DCC48_05630 [Acidobacteriota bacterium]